MHIQPVFPHRIPAFQTFAHSQGCLPFDVETAEGDLSVLNDLPEYGLAIVGTRYPQRRSMEILEEALVSLRGSNLVIISGLARGIDSKAHELAMQNGLRTIAVLGCGIEIQYPRENSHLRKEILRQGGLVLSPFERTAPSLPHHFLYRNQFIAGLAKATWVVEAASASGTLNTAKWASDFNRDLYATSCFPGDHFYQGNEKLLSASLPERYPLATPFFNANSLLATWPQLRAYAPTKGSFPPGEHGTQIQQWVLQLKSEYGKCHVQTLMNHAARNKHTLGQFYLRYEKELADGLLIQDENGCVDLG